MIMNELYLSHVDEDGTLLDKNLFMLKILSMCTKSVLDFITSNNGGDSFKAAMTMLTDPEPLKRDASDVDEAIYEAVDSVRILVEQAHTEVSLTNDDLWMNGCDFWIMLVKHVTEQLVESISVIKSESKETVEDGLVHFLDVKIKSDGRDWVFETTDHGGIGALSYGDYYVDGSKNVVMLGDAHWVKSLFSSITMFIAQQREAERAQIAAGYKTLN